MTKARIARHLLLTVALPACASHQSAHVVRRFHAAEANQGVAVDANFFYAIDNTSIRKYDKRSGPRVGGWQDTTGRISHLDSGIVLDDGLYCARSNYPNTPMVSTIEVFATSGMTHARRHPAALRNRFGDVDRSNQW